MQDLAHERFARDQVTIGFDPKRAQRLPTPLSHALFDLREQVGVERFHLMIQAGLRLAEAKFGILLQQAQHGGVGAPHFALKLAVGPHVHQIEMRMAHQAHVPVQGLARLVDGGTDTLLRGLQRAVKGFAGLAFGVDFSQRLFQLGLQDVFQVGRQVGRQQDFVDGAQIPIRLPDRRVGDRQLGQVKQLVVAFIAVPVDVGLDTYLEELPALGRLGQQNFVAEGVEAMIGPAVERKQRVAAHVETQHHRLAGPVGRDLHRAPEEGADVWAAPAFADVNGAPIGIQVLIVAPGFEIRLAHLPIGQGQAGKKTTVGDLVQAVFQLLGDGDERGALCV